MSASLTPLTEAQWDALLQSFYSAAATEAGLPVADLGENSQLGAFFYAERSALMQQQTQLGYAVLLTNFANLVGADLDAALAQFNFPRNLASFAQGPESVTTISPITVQTLYPVGALLQTPSGLIYRCVADPSNQYYSQALGSYVATPTGSSMPTTIYPTFACTISGTIGNAQPGQIVQPVVGPVNPVGWGSYTNVAAFTNAIDPETDAEYLARFQAKFAGGTDGGSTLSYLANILGLEPNLTVSVAEYVNASGAAQDGWYCIVVNYMGASVVTPTQLLQAATASIDSIRTAGIRRAVIASTPVVVNSTAHLVLANGSNLAAVTALAVAAEIAYINSIGLDPFGGTTTVSIAQIYRAIMGASSSILDVQNLTVNGGTVELTTGFATQFVAGSIVFN